MILNWMLKLNKVKSILILNHTGSHHLIKLLNTLANNRGSRSVQCLIFEF